MCTIVWGRLQLNIWERPILVQTYNRENNLSNYENIISDYDVVTETTSFKRTWEAVAVAQIFFICYLATLRPTFVHYWANSFIRPMFTIAFFFSIFGAKVTVSLVARLSLWFRNIPILWQHLNLPNCIPLIHCTPRKMFLKILQNP